ncbi:MAG: NAD(P)-binding protein, partial [Acidimicrobiales bacterium]|nr:NAD(P)-binding protein [Acidimicrobiales bacterium]
MTDAEVIVVGGGHNGLICGSYLSRSGVDTLLLESRLGVGGCTSTVSDLGARFNICHCDHTLIRAMPIADELSLADHGLRYVEPAAGAIFAFHDGAEPWAVFHDAEQTIDGLAAAYPCQVDAYRRYLRDALPVAELVIAMAGTVP